MRWREAVAKRMTLTLWLVGCGQQNEGMPEGLCRNYGVIDVWGDYDNPEHFSACREVNVVVEATVDGAVTEPVPFGLFTTDGHDFETGEYDFRDVGTEEEVVEDLTTGEPFSLTVPEAGWPFRVWLVATLDERTSAGFPVVDQGGSRWVHEVHDFWLDGDLEDNVQLNLMLIKESAVYSCSTDFYWGDDADPDDHLEEAQSFTLEEGRYFWTPDDDPLGEMGANEAVMTDGSALMIHNPTSGDYAADSDSQATEGGFYLHHSNEDFRYETRCTER